MKKYIIDTNTGKLVYYGNPDKKPELSAPDYEIVDPSDFKRPSKEHKWDGDNWVSDQSMVSAVLIRKIKEEAQRRIDAYSATVKYHEESVVLVDTFSTSGVTKDLSDNDYEAILKYRYDLNHLLDPVSISGTWTFSSKSDTVSGSSGSALSEVTVGQYIQSDTDGVLYKVKDVTDDNTIVLTNDYQQTGGSHSASIVMNLDSPTYPSEPGK